MAKKQKKKQRQWRARDESEEDDEEEGRAEQALRHLTMDPLNGENDIDIELARTAFSVEHFRRMIKKTFTDFHPG